MVQEDQLVAIDIGHEVPVLIEENSTGACLVSWGLWQEFGRRNMYLDQEGTFDISKGIFALYQVPAALLTPRYAW